MEKLQNIKNTRHVSTHIQLNLDFFFLIKIKRGNLKCKKPNKIEHKTVFTVTIKRLAHPVWYFFMIVF